MGAFLLQYQDGSGGGLTVGQIIHDSPSLWALVGVPLLFAAALLFVLSLLLQPRSPRAGQGDN